MLTTVDLAKSSALHQSFGASHDWTTHLGLARSPAAARGAAWATSLLASSRRHHGLGHCSLLLDRTLLTSLNVAQVAHACCSVIT